MGSGKKEQILSSADHLDRVSYDCSLVISSSPPLPRPPPIIDFNAFANQFISNTLIFKITIIDFFLQFFLKLNWVRGPARPQGPAICPRGPSGARGPFYDELFFYIRVNGLQGRIQGVGPQPGPNNQLFSSLFFSGNQIVCRARSAPKGPSGSHSMKNFIFLTPDSRAPQGPYREQGSSWGPLQKKIALSLTRQSMHF